MVFLLRKNFLTFSMDPHDVSGELVDGLSGVVLQVLENLKPSEFLKEIEVVLFIFPGLQVEDAHTDPQNMELLSNSDSFLLQQRDKSAEEVVLEDAAVDESDVLLENDAADDVDDFLQHKEVAVVGAEVVLDFILEGLVLQDLLGDMLVAVIC